MTKDELGVARTLTRITLARGGAPRAVLALLQKTWDAPALLIKADGDRTLPGEHGIPEIARQERSFFNALTAGQKDAYRAIAALVEKLYREGKGSWAGVDPWRIGDPIDEWKRHAFLSLATHPMQAYMVGQMLLSEALKSPIARPLYPTDRRAIEFLEHTTFNEIDGSFEELKRLLRERLIRGMQDGANPQEVARHIAADLKNYDTDFALVTITETSRADATGRLHELADAGMPYAIGSSAHDQKTCDACKELIDGKVVKVADTIGLTNKGRKRDQWVPCIPLHPRCRCVWLPHTAETQDVLRA